MKKVSMTFKRPRLYPKQQDAIFNDSRYSVVEASTKSGKTFGCIVWITERALKGKSGTNYWWLAPVYQQAQIAYNRLKPGGVNGLPREIASANDSQLKLSLINGTTIWFKSAEKPDNLYGEDVHAAVLDEATRMREESWHAVRSTLTATRGPIRIIGNVKGRKNWVYHLARKAEAGEQGMEYHKITAHDAIEARIIDASEVEDARRQLPPAIFQELYMADAAEDEGNPFGIEAIRLRIGKLGSGPVQCWGWDLAKKVDWTVGIGLDANNTVCAVERFQKPWKETFKRIMEVTGTTPALVDSTGVGDPIMESLQREGGENFEGFNFGSANKQKIMEGLAVSISRGPIQYPDGPIVNELESFEYEYTRTAVKYSAPEGMHDDCVCALALAVYHNSGVKTDAGIFF